MTLSHTHNEYIFLLWKHFGIMWARLSKSSMNRFQCLYILLGKESSCPKRTKVIHNMQKLNGSAAVCLSELVWRPDRHRWAESRRGVCWPPINHLSRLTRCLAAHGPTGRAVRCEDADHHAWLVWLERLMLCGVAETRRHSLCINKYASQLLLNAQTFRRTLFHCWPNCSIS